MIVDHVDYEMPWGFLGHLAHWMSVKQSLEQIFAFREQRIREIFPDQAGMPVARMPKSPGQSTTSPRAAV